MTKKQRSGKICKKWQKLVSEQAESGQTITAFCRHRALGRQSFFAWRKRLSQTEPKEFVQVKAAKPAEPARCNRAIFEHLPVTTHVYGLKPEERACPCCGIERKEIGADESWQVEYIPGRFERIRHVRKKYACPGCESGGESPQIEIAAKPEEAIDKGMAGPGCRISGSSARSSAAPLFQA